MIPLIKVPKISKRLTRRYFIDNPTIMQREDSIARYFPYGLINLKKYETSNFLNFDYGKGSRLLSVATSRTANPATYIDSAGIINSSSTDDVGLISKGYYDTTGFHSRAAGLINESESTNYLIDSYCNRDSDSDGLCDSWVQSVLTTVTNTVTYSSIITNTDQTVADLINITGAGYQKIAYTGVAGDSSKILVIRNNLLTSDSFTSGDIVTLSVFAKGSLSGCNLYLRFYEGAASGSSIRSTDSSEFTLSSTDWRRFSFSVTCANATAKTITAFSDYSGTVAGAVLVTFTTADTAYLTNDTVTIAGTTNYNGTYTVTKVSTTQYYITHAWSGNDATGTSTKLVSTGYWMIVVKNIDNTDTIDLKLTGRQLEKLPYVTSYIPTTTAAATRNKTIISGTIANNRNAAAETMFLKWSPIRVPIQSGSAILHITNTKTRKIAESASGPRNTFFPNTTDSISCITAGNNSPTVNTPVIYTLVCDNSASKSVHARFYVNGSPSATSPTDTDSFTTNAWGTNFYLGCDNNEISQHDAVIHSITIFNSELSANEITNVNTILSNEN